MTREELIEAILAEAVQGMAGGTGGDWATGASDQEFTFQNMVNKIARTKKRKQMGFKNPGIHEGKDREIGESMDTIYRVAKKSALGKVAGKGAGAIKRGFKRNAVRPFTGTMRAVRYQRGANMQAAVGNWDRSLTMHRRARKVIRGHAPALMGAAVGMAGGVVFPSPGATELGGIIGAQGGKVVNRLARIKVRP